MQQEQAQKKCRKRTIVHISFCLDAARSLRVVVAFFTCLSSSLPGAARWRNSASDYLSSTSFLAGLNSFETYPLGVTFA